MAGSAWSTFSPATKIKSSPVNQNFEWAHQHLFPHNAGSLTSHAYDLGASATRWRAGYLGAVNLSNATNTVTLLVNNGTSTADTVQFLDNGATVASVSNEGYFRAATGTAAAPGFSFFANTGDGFSNPAPANIGLSLNGILRVGWNATAYFPHTDNSMALGGSGNRWTEVFAFAGSINTSSLTEKRDVRDIAKAEIKVPRAIQFRFNPEYGRLAERPMIGFAADDLPLEAHPKDANGNYDMKNVYTNAVIGMLCAAYHDLKARIDAIESAAKA